MRAWLAFGVLFTAFGATTGAVSAQEGDPPPATPPTEAEPPPPTAQAEAPDGAGLDEAARLTFQQARQHFMSGEYEEALRLFQQAYELSNRAGLLYNIAQSLDRLRRDEETVFALREYLAAAPDANNRREVEARIEVLDAAIAEADRNRPPPPPPGGPDPEPVVESDPLAILHPGVFIAVGGVALVAGGLSVWSGLETVSLNDSYIASTDLTQARSLQSDAETQQLLTNIFIFSAGGLGAAAIVFAIITDWGAFDGGDPESADAGSVRPTVDLGPAGATLGMAGTF